ncbi:MAG: secondary thiamine-phosphate synthase enzyme YjbQ [Planctomycetota bacterium]|jgi:secondary thiamine-phosphate synthase enzyme
METFQVKTGARTQLVDITAPVRDALASSGVESGLATVFVPHTTAGVTINENADPSVARDVLMEVDKVVPFEDGYHHGEGNSAAHIKSSLFGPSLTLIVEDGRLQLGTWQGIYFCEFDGPRNRRVHVKCVPG